MTIKELRLKSKMKQEDFADYFSLPVSTLRNWEQEHRKCPDYLLKLIEYKLKKEKLI